MTEWSRLPLRRVARVVNGGTPPPDEANWNGGIPWATPIDIGAANRHILQTQRTLTHAGAMAGSRIVPADSVLVSTRAPIGYVAIAAKPMAFNQGCRALVPGDRLDSRFLYYQLSVSSAELNRRGLGTTFLELSANNLADVEVTIPPRGQQRRIADFLDTETARIDSLIDLVKHAAELLNLRRRHLVLAAITSPAEQKTTTPLRYLATSVSVGIVITPARWYVEQDGVLALRGLNIQPGRITTHDVVQISHEGHAMHAKSRLRGGDLVVVRTGQTGVAAVIPEQLDGCNCIDLVIVRPGRNVMAKYLEIILNSDFATQFITELSVGTIQSHLNVNALKQLPIPRRSVSQQVAVIESVRQIDTEANHGIDLMRQQIRLLKERRQALITAAVTGQFDVVTGRGADLESFSKRDLVALLPGRGTQF